MSASREALTKDGMKGQEGMFLNGSAFAMVKALLRVFCCGNIA